MSIETFIRNQIRNREARLRSPGFRAEMAREKREFGESLNDLGDSALDFVYSGFLKEAFIGGAKSSAKLLFKEKYGVDNFFKDNTKGLLRTAKMGTKVVYHVARSTGKLAKMGIRQLIAR